MFFSSLFRHHRRRSLYRPRWVPRLEALEDRIALSTLTVTSAADDGSAGTLRAVLAEANNGDTIKFAHQLDGQTITLTQGQLMVNQNVNIDGPGASKLTISGNAAGRIFDIGNGADVTISGLTLTDGLAAEGGGILNAGNLTLYQDTISGNVAQGTAANGGNAFGGGIYNQTGSVTIDHSALIGNQAIGANGGSVGVVVPLPGGNSVTLLDVGMGGGVWNDGGSLTVSDSTLSNNLAQGGSNGDGSQNTTQYLIVGTATGGALGSGAFFATQTPSLSISGSNLSNNKSLGGSNLLEAIPNFPNPTGLAADAGSGRGGAVGIDAGDLSITGSTLDDNTAEGGSLVTSVVGGKTVNTHGSDGIGGGISDEYDLGFTTPAAFPNLNILGSTIQGNAALGNGPSGFGSGGGLDTTNVAVQVTNSTVSGNQVLGGPGGGFAFISTTSGFTFTLNNGGGGASGGGISSSAGSLTIAASAIVNNVAQGGPGIVKAVTGSFFFGGKPGWGGDSDGGGIYSSGQILDLTTATLSGNQSLGGTAIKGFNQNGNADAGALEMSGDTATISGTAFRDNLAQAGVGGIGGDADGGGADGGGGSLQLTDSTFSGNQAISQGVTQGGGLSIFGTNAAISNTLFTGNLAQGTGEGVGGALDVVEFSNSSGITPTVSNCGFVQNTAQGGEDGEGGGMFVSGQTTMSILNSAFVADKAVGGDNVFRGQGGFALGGGLDIDAFSTVQVSNCSFRFDAAIGGNGGAGSSNNLTGGAGGFAAGGGVQVDYGSTATISNAGFYGNSAQGGAGGAGTNGGAGGAGGLGQGGALANDGATTTVNNSSFILNAAVGGVGGTGGTDAAGGAGGAGQGGGIYSTAGFSPAGVLNVSSSLLTLNVAQGGVGGAGGAGGIGGNGGDGDGGGIFNDAGSTATVLTSTIVGNFANGGAAASGGSAGQGVGGGVYNLGTFDVDSATVIADNYASTSDDNEYGTITLI